jgi:hypothetical protein
MIYSASIILLQLTQSPPHLAAKKAGHPAAEDACLWESSRRPHPPHLTEPGRSHDPQPGHLRHQDDVTNSS